jgi:hypothetical protein
MPYLAKMRCARAAPWRPDDDDDDHVYFKKITTRISQNLSLHKKADQPKARVSESRYK